MGTVFGRLAIKHSIYSVLALIEAMKKEFRDENKTQIKSGELLREKHLQMAAAGATKLFIKVHHVNI